MKVYRIEIYNYPDTRWIYISEESMEDALKKANKSLRRIVEIRELGDLHE